MSTPQIIHAHRTYSSAEVARLVFNRSTRWLERNRARLQKEEGFPVPRKAGNAFIYPGARLLTWLASDPTAPPHSPAQPAISQPSPDGSYQHIIDQRLGALGAA